VRKLPLKRKIIPVGKTNRTVIIPKSWLQFFEQEGSQPIENVAIEVNHGVGKLGVKQMSAKVEDCEFVNEALAIMNEVCSCCFEKMVLEAKLCQREAE